MITDVKEIEKFLWDGCVKATEAGRPPNGDIETCPLHSADLNSGGRSGWRDPAAERTQVLSLADAERFYDGYDRNDVYGAVGELGVKFRKWVEAGKPFRGEVPFAEVTP